MVNLNGNLVNELPEHIQMLQRGLYYGDSLFESLRVFEGKLPLLEAHWRRLAHGMHTMGYAVPPHWGTDYFKNQILRVSPANARVRLTIWRMPGGLYLPTASDPGFLITATPLTEASYEWPLHGHTACLSERVRLPIDALSGLKTLNAARYVAAAVEARKRGFEDAIVLNGQDSVCEAVSGNIFWFENSRLHTPPRGNGALTGILQNLLFALTDAAGTTIVEENATFARVLAADEVFTTNAVRGVLPLGRIEETVKPTHRTKAIHDLVVAHISHLIATEEAF